MVFQPAAIARYINALESAKNLGAKLRLSGRDGGKMNGLCDLNIIVPSNVTARIQEIHILIGIFFAKPWTTHSEIS